jgi:adenylylsulfate kinase
MAAEHRIPLLIVTGPVGVGKTTVAYEVSNLLATANLPHACIDMDTLRSCYPAPAGDRFNVALGLRNLAAVWANCRAVGATHLVVADVIESRDELQGYREAVPGAAISVVRLRATLSTLTGRVTQREVGSSRDWHLLRSAELAAQMDRDQVEDLVVDTDGRTVAEIAREVAERSGWAVPATR